MNRETGGYNVQPGEPTKPLMPAEEKVYAPVFAYRGIEQHGVLVEDTPWLPRDGDAEDWDGESQFEAEPIPTTPVPVYIVANPSAGNSRRERVWSAFQAVAGTAPAQIVGRDENRERVTIRNLHATAVLFIGRANMASTLDGYPLDPGQTITIQALNEVWGISTQANVYTSVMVEGWQ